MKSEMSRKADIFHPHTLVIHSDFEALRGFVLSLPERFEKNEGIVIHKGRNELRKMEYKGREYVVKSFHRPNFINRFVYGIFRPSKAKRSYDHAELYRNIGVGTPQPVGYLNVRSGLLFDRSYYVSCLSACPYVYNDLFKQKFEYEEDVLREIGRVTAVLHEHGYAHKDYGRENILFQKTPEGIKLEIVDLNRMFIGTIGGTIGETSALALLLGAAYLLIKKVITWKIPVCYIGTFAIFALIFGGRGFDLTYLAAEICGGGLMLGAFFMATDLGSVNG